MGVARRGVGHLVLGHLAGLGIELADEPRAVTGVPDVAVAIRDETVRTGVGRGQRPLADLPGRHVDTPEIVRALTRVPQAAVDAESGIVRVGVWRRRVPIGERDVNLFSTLTLQAGRLDEAQSCHDCCDRRDA